MKREESNFELFSKEDVRQLNQWAAEQEEERKRFIPRCKQAIEKKRRIRSTSCEETTSDSHPEDIEFKSIFRGDNLEITGDLEIIEIEENKEAYKIIGEVKILVFDEQWDDLDDSFDSIDQNVYETMSYFNVKGHKSLFGRDAFSLWGRIALIDRFYLYPEYRGKGYGSEFFEKIMNHLENVLCCNFIVLKPYPLFESSDSKITEKTTHDQKLYDLIASLVLFYEKYGFGTQSSRQYFYQCLEIEQFNGLEYLSAED